MWGKKKAVEEPVDLDESIDEVFDDLYAELDDIVETADEPEAEVPVDFEARVAELEKMLRDAQEGARLARLAAKPEGLSPFKTPFEAKPAAVVERPRDLNRRITPVEVEPGESRIVSQFEDEEPEDKKVYPAVWNLGYRLEELAAAVAGILVDEDTGELKHEHDGYAATDHDHPDLEYDDTAVKDAIRRNGELIDDLKNESRQGDADLNKKIDEHSHDDEDGKGYNNAYTPGDPLNEGEYSAGDKTATFNETDAEGNPFATPDDPWLVTCDDGPIMRITGAAAGATDAEGRVTVTWDSDHTLSGNVKLGVVDPVPEHGHDEYATKSDLESLEAELELLAKTLESGQWKVISTPAPRPGEMWIAFDQFNAQQNQIVLNSEDMSGTNHGWATVHENDFIELLDKSDQQSRDIEHDYALFLVTKVEKGTGTITIDLDLYQGQGDCLPDEVFEVRVLDIGDSDLDLDGLDARYVKKTGDTEVTGRWQLTQKNNSGTSYILQKLEGSSQYLYNLPDPTVTMQAANKRYVDTRVNEHGHSGVPWNSKTGIPAWNRKVWAASSPGSSAFTPYTGRGDGYETIGSGYLVKDTTSIRFKYPEVHTHDFSGNGCLAFSMSNDNMDRLMAVFQILYVTSSSSNYYTQVRLRYLWGLHTDTMRWKFSVNSGDNFTSTELRWGYMMVTGGGYWGPR